MKNHLFTVLLMIMAAVGCLEAITAKSTEAFVYASSAMCLSTIVWLIHDKYPLFKK